MDPKKNNGSTKGSKCALVYGQMNEPPGARARVGLSGLTVAEYFRDQGQDVLFFVDNIFRFTQAGSEVSALLGRIPSAVGYQPTLATDMGALQERITTTQKGSITSVQAIYVPADDLTDPAPATSFAHLDATTVLSRSHRREGHLSGRRPARIPPRACLEPRVVGEEHYQVARQVQQILQRYKSLQDIIAILGMDELSEEDKTDGGARAQDRALPVAALPRGRGVHGLARQVRAARRTRSRASRDCAPATTTICRSRRSTWSAPSKRRSPRPRSWPRRRNPEGSEGMAAEMAQASSAAAARSQGRAGERRVRAADRRGRRRHPLHVDRRRRRRGRGRAQHGRPSGVLLPLLRHQGCRRPRRSTPRPATPTDRRMPGMSRTCADGWHLQVRARDARAHGALAGRRAGLVPAWRAVHGAARPRARHLGAAPRHDRGHARRERPDGRASSSRAALPRWTPTASRCWPSAHGSRPDERGVVAAELQAAEAELAAASRRHRPPRRRFRRRAAAGAAA